MCDPKELPGLAHFLEHMLFYSSEKYPIEDAYMKFMVRPSSTLPPNLSPSVALAEQAILGIQYPCLSSFRLIFYHVLPNKQHRGGGIY